MNMDSKNEQKRLLLLMSPATYRAGAFLNAAKNLNLKIVVGIDLPETLSEYWHGPLGLGFNDMGKFLRNLVVYAQVFPLAAIISVDDSVSELPALATTSVDLHQNLLLAVLATRG